MTFEELILSIEVEREQTVKRRDRAIASVKAILARAKTEARANLTPEEDADVKTAFDTRNRANADLIGIDAKLKNAREALAAETEAAQSYAEVRSEPATAAAKLPAYDRVARVGSEERTYNKGNTRQGGPFLRDIVMQYLYRDLESEQRLLRHMQEERVERGQYLERAVGTGAFAGLVVPQYLTDMFAPAVAALRPFADACNKHPLPANGMTVNISRITTATGVALQASENTAVQETNADDTLLTEAVQTAAGQQTISRQAIDRGTGVEEILMDDLMRRYATAVDGTLINQATTGLSAVAVANAYTDASPTGAEMYPKILQAAAGGEAALLGFAQPDIAIMHSRRWYWLNAQMTSTWPLLSQPGLATQSSGQNLNERYGRGARGLLPNGIVAIVDNNIPTGLGAGTNEDEVYVVPSDECHLWEDPNAPVFIRAEQPAAGSLGVLLVAYGYFAYSFRRFTNAMQKIGGTGLVPPAF